MNKEQQSMKSTLKLKEVLMGLVSQTYEIGHRIDSHIECLQEDREKVRGLHKAVLQAYNEMET